MTDYSRELNKGIKIFSQLYVGFHKQRGTVPLGFATPYENNAAFRKRKETIDKWKNNGDKIIDNAPRSGFKITDDVKRVYWGGGNVVWRVQDPLGFELEIQSNNLFAIISCCDLESGTIKGNCVWGRDGRDNILLHESSEEYKNAFKAAETLKPPSTTPKKDRVVGGLYLMRDGSEMIYLGKMFTYIPVTDKREDLYSRDGDGYADFVQLKDSIELIDKASFGRSVPGMYIRSSRYSAGSIKEFNVVMSKDERNFIFYKGDAPLIRRLDDHVYAVPSAVQASAFTKLSFAGNDTGTILYAQDTKFTSVKFGLRQPSEQEFTNLVQASKSYYSARKEHEVLSYFSAFTIGGKVYLAIHKSELPQYTYYKYKKPMPPYIALKYQGSEDELVEACLNGPLENYITTSFHESRGYTEQQMFDYVNMNKTVQQMFNDGELFITDFKVDVASSDDHLWKQVPKVPSRM